MINLYTSSDDHRVTKCLPYVVVVYCNFTCHRRCRRGNRCISCSSRGRRRRILGLGENFEVGRRGYGVQRVPLWGKVVSSRIDSRHDSRISIIVTNTTTTTCAHYHFIWNNAKPASLPITATMYGNGTMDLATTRLESSIRWSSDTRSLMMTAAAPTNVITHPKEQGEKTQEENGNQD